MFGNLRSCKSGVSDVDLHNLSLSIWSSNLPNVTMNCWRPSDPAVYGDESNKPPQSRLDETGARNATTSAFRTLSGNDVPRFIYRDSRWSAHGRLHLSEQLSPRRDDERGEKAHVVDKLGWNQEQMNLAIRQARPSIPSQRVHLRQLQPHGRHAEGYEWYRWREVPRYQAMRFRGRPSSLPQVVEKSVPTLYSYERVNANTNALVPISSLTQSRNERCHESFSTTDGITSYAGYAAAGNSTSISVPPTVTSPSASNGSSNEGEAKRPSPNEDSPPRDGLAKKFKSNNKFQVNFSKLDLLCSATLEVGPLQESGPCSCPKSKCIALYCDCFKAGRRCTDRCTCLDCKNTVAESGADGLRTRAIHLKLARNPRAFTGGTRAVAPPGELVCNCVRSRCLKLYCNCFQNGKVCNAACSCVSCLNTEEENRHGGCRTIAVQQCLEKRPDAFRKRPKVVGSGCACKNNR